MISKKKYKELVQQSLASAQQKVVILKLQAVIKQKCARINELTKVFSQHKYLLKKIAKEKEQESFVSIRQNRTRIHLAICEVIVYSSEIYLLFSF